MKYNRITICSAEEVHALLEAGTVTTRCVDNAERHYVLFHILLIAKILKNK